MLRILNASILGITGRQSELIELALTYGFKGIDLDITDLRKRVQAQGFEQARHYLESARLCVSSFEIPCRYFESAQEQAAELAEVAKTIEIGALMGAKSCITTILPASNHLPFHQNFEFHAKYLRQLAELAGKHGMSLGVGSLAAASHRAGKAFQFIYQPDQLLMLIKTSGAANLGVLIDTWNWHVGGGTLEWIRKLCAHEIIGVRMADVPPGSDSALLTDDQRLLPTESSDFDHAALLSHLSALEYQGPLVVYVPPSALGSSKREQMVQRIAKGLDSLYQAAGLTKNGKRATAGAS